MQILRPHVRLTAQGLGLVPSMLLQQGLWGAEPLPEEFEEVLSLKGLIFLICKAKSLNDFVLTFHSIAFYFIP